MSSDAKAMGDDIAHLLEEREKLRAEILKRDKLNAALTRKIELLETTASNASASNASSNASASTEAAPLLPGSVFGEEDEINLLIRNENVKLPAEGDGNSNLEPPTKSKRLKKEDVASLRDNVALKQKATPFLSYASPDEEHTLLVADLVDGSTNSLSLLDSSTNTNIKRLRLAEIVHVTPSNIVGMLFNESTQDDAEHKSSFKRYTLQEDHSQTMSKIVYWVHNLTERRVVEYLLELRLETTNEFKAIKITPVDQAKLSTVAMKKLDEIIEDMSVSKVQRVGQTLLTLIGTLAVEQRQNQGSHVIDAPSSRSTFFTRASLMVGFSSSSSSRLSLSSKSLNSTGNNSSNEGDLNEVHSSLATILSVEVAQHFQDAEVIDTRRKTHFEEVVMPSVAPLSTQENLMLEKVGKMENQLIERGKRWGSSKGCIEKFLWTEKNSQLAGFRTTIDKSAKGILAEAFTLDTYERAHRHKQQNGSLPWLVRKNVGGKLGFTCKDLSGFHIITEMAPNICRYTRVQIIAMKLNVPKAVMGRIANSQLFNHGKSLEQKYKRNPAKVDAEAEASYIIRRGK
ncbi:hypothetical protein TrRE_jg3360 [Triparma retinervis]|uniref:Uncharacterized protein n=1 Tax=Triparma retinervis TaxID=2557542 RepID=A0A9W7A5F0_9STRA|nr:hypothetical protein TrRE_jg3360 [Triparma retinervis]